MRKKVRIITMGCSKNQVDSENLLGEFGRAGFSLALEGDTPQVTVINTCGFIESAKEESISEILSSLQLREIGEKLVVAGCLSQRYLEDLRKDIPEVDLYVGTYKPGELLSKMGLTSSLPSDCQFGVAPRTLIGDSHHHAFLKIAEGCNRICGFCAIPGMRGKQRSKTISQIVQEAQELEQWGVREISLIAQDLTYFGRESGGKETLAQLLHALVQHTDLPWIRLMYAYPGFIEDDLLEIMASESRICNYMDIPIQHASTRVLKSMRRNYSREQLFHLLIRIKSAIPEISLRTTVLVGYPGEREEDVDELLALMEEVRFKHLGGFCYSDEEGTHAFDLDDKVSPHEMEERLERVMTLQQQISLEENQKCIGKTVQVIIDEVAEGQDCQFIGRTAGDAPEADNRVLIHCNEHSNAAELGSFRGVFITDAMEYDLEGNLLP